MKKVVVASKNQVKITAAQIGFSKMFPQEKFEFIGVAVSSGIPDQPQGNQETFQGAVNRVQDAQRRIEGADFYVGMEGGVEFSTDYNTIGQDQEELAAFAWIVIKSGNLLAKARTGTFFLPTAISKLVKEGKELGDADDIVFKQQDSKRNNGGVGILTKNVATRTAYYSEAVILALIPFKNPNLY